MILLAGSQNIDSSPLALTDASRRAPNRERGPYPLVHTCDTTSTSFL